MTWLALVSAAVTVNTLIGHEVATCLFHAASGLPCATCGGTRATFALLGGDWLAALTLNPLVAIGWALMPVALLAARIPSRHANLPNARRIAAQTAIGWTLIALLALNWGYLLARELTLPGPTY